MTPPGYRIHPLPMVSRASNTFAMERGSIFLLGVTGYIGGSVLHGLLDRYPSFEYTALVRNPQSVPQIEALGVKVRLGSNEDVEDIEKIASGHDIVVNCSNSNSPVVATALINGLRSSIKFEPGERRRIYIHTNSTGIVTDTKPQGVDLEMFAAAERGGVDVYIVAPTTTYGRGRGPVRTMSMQIPQMIRAATKRNEVVLSGPSTTVWSNVHIDDLVGLFLLVYKHAISGLNLGVGRSNFFWGSAGEHVWGDVAKELAHLMHEQGLVASKSVRGVSPDDEVPELVGSVAKTKMAANRSFAVGWKPKGPTLIESLPEEIDMAVKSTPLGP